MWDYASRNIPGNNIADVSYDGKQFVAVVTDAKLSAQPITIVVNWNEELRKKWVGGERGGIQFVKIIPGDEL